MEQNNTLFGEISRVIGKISKDWERVSAAGQPVSRIEKDILLDDLRSAYQLLSEIEVAPSPFSAKTGPVDIPYDVFADEKPFATQVIEDPKEEPLVQPAAPLPVSPPTVLMEYEKPNIEEVKENIEVKSEPEMVFEKEPEYSKTAPEIKPATNDLFATEPKTETPRTEPKHVSPQPKMMVDLFTPQKTVSDVLHGNTDKTVATKIQNNLISDIKAAIGINDKFTFVNDIFKGEISRYNHAIDHLNSLETFQDAENYIFQQGLRSGTPENMAALAKLTDLLKRKYQH